MNSKRKSQKAALITGGAKRLGKAICMALSSRGYDIALHYNHSTRAAKQTAEAIERRKGRCTLFPCDLSNEAQTTQLIPNALRTFPKLSVLINNASIFEPSSIRQDGLKSIHRHFPVNLVAPYTLTALFAQHCAKGNIINILDTHITRNQTNYAAYLLSKKALCALTKLSAVELAPHIRVNAVAPGFILAPEEKRLSYSTRLIKSIPLQKKGTVDQIAQSIIFLLENPFLTGQIIFNDGGEHLI